MNWSRWFRDYRQMLPEFIEFLQSRNAFEDADCGRMYDTGLCAQVVGPCLDNLKRFGGDGMIEQLPEFLDDEQKEVLKRICRSLQ